MLGALQGGLRPPAFESHPVNLGTTPPPPPIPSTAALSKAQANAALYGTIAKTLDALPQTIFGSYLHGKQIGNQNSADNIVGNALAGTPPTAAQAQALQGMTLSPNGVSYTPPTPYAGALAALDLKEKQADVDLKAAKVKQITLTPFDQADAAIKAAEGQGTAPATAPGKTIGTVFGKVPSGRFNDDGTPIAMDDPNDVTDAHVKGFDPNKGAWGADIKDPNLVGVALPISALTAAGVDPNTDPSKQGYAAEVTLPNGTVQQMPIVDKNGTNSVDFTYGAYSKIGGRQDVKGGDSIPGVSYKIVKTGSAPAPAPAPAPAAPTASPAPAAPPNNAPGADEVSAAEGGLAALAGVPPPSGAQPPAPALAAAPTAAAPPALATGPQGSPGATGSPGALTAPAAPIAAKPPYERVPGMNAIIQHLPGGQANLLIQGHPNPIPIKDPNAKSAGYGSVAEMKAANPDGAIQDWTVDADGRYHPGKILPQMHLSPQTINLAGRAGYTPQPGETDAMVQAKALKAMSDQDILSPDQIKARQELAKEMAADPQLKAALNAKHAMENMNAALADPDHLDPFKVKSAMDAFNVVANNQASLGPKLTKMLEQGTTTRTQLTSTLDNLKDFFSGGNSGNQQQVLPKESVLQLADMTKKLNAAHADDVDKILESYRSEAHDIGLPGNQADKLFARFGKIGSAGQTPGAVATPASGVGAASSTDPAANLAAVQAKGAAVLKRYNAGEFKGDDKARAEQLLKTAGLLQ